MGDMADDAWLEMEEMQGIHFLHEKGECGGDNVCPFCCWENEE